MKNAFKFCRNGSVRIIAAYDEVEEQLLVHVVDTGKGIKEEEKNMLFKQFGKLLRTADMNHEGIGMGLMICQNLVMMNDGEISVHSDGVDKGSAFSFTMKMQNPSITKSMKKEAQTPKTSQILTGSQAELKIEEQKIINAPESAVLVKESSSVSSSSSGESTSQNIM